MRSLKSDPRPSKAIEFPHLCGKRTTDLVTGLVSLSGCDLSPWGSSFSARALLFSFNLLSDALGPFTIFRNRKMV
jgi:hypothetical protein